MSEPSSVETEIKLSVPHPRIFDRLARMASVPGYSFGELDEVRIEDTYKDTADFRLLRAGLALRERRNGNRFTLTVKGLGGANGSYHRREEIEEDRDRSIGDGLAGDGAVGCRVGPILSGSPLVDLFSFGQTRRMLPLLRHGRHRAILSIDEVTMTRGNRSSVFREVEVEGVGDDLPRIGRWLADAFSLSSEPRTKFEKALEFFGVVIPADIADIADAAEAQSPAVELRPDMSLAEAVRLLLGRQLAVFRDNEARILDAPTAEAVHDMRVAAQRARAVVRLLPPDTIKRKRIDSVLKTVRDHLGAVRDLHVLPKTLRRASPYVATADKGDVAEALEAAAAEAERQGEALQAYLRSHEYLTGRAEHLDGRPSIEEPDHRASPLQLRDALSGILLHRIGLVDSYHRRVSPGCRGELHELRKLLKTARYALEFFAPVLGPGAKRLRKATVRVQDHLGLVQDSEVAAGVCRQLCSPLAASRLAEALDALAVDEEEAAAGAWLELCNPSLRHDLFEEIARA